MRHLISSKTVPNVLLKNKQTDVENDVEVEVLNLDNLIDDTVEYN